MAVEARSITLDRETLDQWLTQYTGKADHDSLRTYLLSKLHGGEFEGAMVNTSQRTDISADEAPLIDLIMDDLPSYASYQKIFS